MRHEVQCPHCPAKVARTYLQFHTMQFHPEHYYKTQKTFLKLAPMLRLEVLR